MKARFPNGLEAEGSPQDLAEFVTTLTERLKSAPPALPEAAAVPPPEPFVVVPEPPVAPIVAAAPAECSVCGRSFDNGHGLAVHVRRAHKEFTVFEGLATGEVRIRSRPVEEGGPAKRHECGVCGIVFDSGGALGGHMKSHNDRKQSPPEGGPEPEEPPPMAQSPEPTTSPVAKMRLTDKICAEAVSATFDGKTVGAWAEATRFRGNMGALIAWVNMVVRATNRMAWRAMPVADQERFVLRAIGGRVREEALAGGSG